MKRAAALICVGALLLLIFACQSESVILKDAYPVVDPHPPALNYAEPGDAEEKWAALLEQNDELVGWITVPGTTIDYPVMQSADNYKYLTLNFYGQYSAYGTPFIDCDCTINPLCSNVVLYGHASSSGALFGQLDAYLDAEYAIQNKTIECSTIYAPGSYTIFAVFKAPVRGPDVFDYTRCRFSDEMEFQAFINEAKQRSVVAFETLVEHGDRILTIQTCSFDGYGERLVVMARMDT